MAYEGEDPDFGDLTSEDLLSIVGDAVHIAEEAAQTAENETDTTQDAVQSTKDFTGAEEEPIP